MDLHCLRNIFLLPINKNLTGFQEVGIVFYFHLRAAKHRTVPMLVEGLYQIEDSNECDTNLDNIDSEIDVSELTYSGTKTVFCP